MTLLELPRQLDGLAWKIVDESVTVSTEKGDVLEVSLLPLRHPLGQVLAVDPKAAAVRHHSGTVLSVITAHREFVKTHDIDVVQGRTLPGVTSSLAGISAFAWASQPGFLYAAKGNAIWTMRPSESTPIPLIGTDLPIQLDVERLASNADGSLLMALMKSNTAQTYWLTKVWAIDRKDGNPNIRCDVTLPDGFPIKESAIFSFRPHRPGVGNSPRSQGRALVIQRYDLPRSSQVRFNRFPGHPARRIRGCGIRCGRHQSLHQQLRRRRSHRADRWNADP